MSAEDTVAETQTEPTEEVVNTEAVEETTTEVSTEDAPEYTEHEKKMFERAKKAEAEAKALKAELGKLQPKPQPTGDQLSQKDLLAVVRENVHDEDLPDIEAYAKIQKVSVADALKTSFVKSLRREREEERKSSQVANAGGSKRTTSKPTDDQLLSGAHKPKNDDEWKALVKVRTEQQRR